MASGPANLLSLLAAAERDMVSEQRAPSEFTADSEERDELPPTQQLEAELELRSQSSISARFQRPGHRSMRRSRREGRLSGGRGGGAQSSSAWSLSAKHLQQLQQQQQLPQSPASVGSSADTASSEEVYRLLKLANQHMVALRQTEAAAAVTHRQQMAAVQAKLDQIRELELQAQKDMINSEAMASITRAGQQMDIDILQKSIDDSEESKLVAEENALASGQFLEKVELRAEEQLDEIRGIVEAKRRRQADTDKEERQSNFDFKSAMVIEITSLTAQLEKTKKELKMVVAERDVLRRNVARRWGATINADNLELVLEVASRELAQIEWAANPDKKLKQASPDFSRVYELLRQSKDSQESMDREMRSLREQWFDARDQLDRAAEQRELESDEGSTGVGSSRGGSGSRGRGLPGGPSTAARPEPRATRSTAPATSKLLWACTAGALASIAEEEDADLISGEGSLVPAERCDGESRAPDDAATGVADLTDFGADFDIQQAENVSTLAALAAAVKMKDKMLREKVHELSRQRDEGKRQKEQLKQEMADEETELSAKIDDALTRLAVGKDGAVQREEQTAYLRQDMAKEDARMLNLVGDAMAERDLLEKRREGKDEHIERLFGDVTQREFQEAEDKALWLDLCREFDWWSRAAREAEAEVEHHRLNLEALHERQEKVVQDAQRLAAPHRLCLVAGLGGEDGSLEREELPPMGELEKSRKEAQDATEDRNMLLNVMEWKEVQWRNEIEELEAQVTSERLALQASHAAEVQQQKEQMRQELESLRLSLSLQAPSRA